MRFLATVCLALSVPAAAPSASDQHVHCNISALTSADRARDRQLIPVLQDNLQERKELPDGYAYRFPPTVLKEVGEWVAIEAKCCQPLAYTVAIEPQPGGSLWVKITGYEAKEFLDTEFAPLMAKLATPGTAR